MDEVKISGSKIFTVSLFLIAFTKGNFISLNASNIAIDMVPKAIDKRHGVYGKLKLWFLGMLLVHTFVRLYMLLLVALNVKYRLGFG